MALQHTALYDEHVAAGAKFAEFGGWEMPLEYSGVVAEHTAVRERVGIFDVSHLGKLLVKGDGAYELINSTLTNDLARIAPGEAQYTLCCDPQTGGIVDDLIVYLKDDDHLLLMPNASNSAAVRDRLQAVAPASVTITDHHADEVVIAVQGPRVDEVMTAVGLPVGHDYMSFVEASFDGHPVVVCRTGYTGERGYEIVAPNAVGVRLWQALLAAGEPVGMALCGLGSRDTLRTEMGYPLHGQDLTVNTTPNQAMLGWAVGWTKPAFWGKEVLEAEKEAVPRVALRGIVAAKRAIPRPQMSVRLSRDLPIGEVTSGTFSPTLKKGVGLALINRQIQIGAEVSVDVRGRQEIFVVTKPPFVQPEVK